MSKNEVAEKTGTELVTIDFSEEAGAGLENTTMEDFARSFLVVLEKMSPHLDEDNLKYIKGAKAGDIINTVTGEIWKGAEGLRVVPCHYMKKDVEWAPNRGGFVMEHDVGENLMSKTKRSEDGRYDQLPNGNTLTPTATFYVAYEKKDGTWDWAIIAMSYSRMKSSREWLTKIQGIKFKHPNTGNSYTPPAYSHIYNLKTRKMQKEDKSWYIWDASVDVVIKDPALYGNARELHQKVRDGVLKAKLEHSVDADAEKVEDPTPF